jgi:ABC-type dipeptide/oligopeptide/nickel transport system ATPase subunit
MSTNANRNDSPLVFSDIKKYGFVKELERQDILKTQKYATALYEFILTCNTPMTVGIQGDWGIGKTSMMEMIKAHIEAKIKIDGKDLKSEEIGVLWFNTWQYSLFGRDEFLGIAAIQTILKLMKEQYDKKEGSNFFDKISNAVSKISEVSIFGVGVKVNAEDKSKDPESHETSGDISDYLKELRTEFQHLVKKVKQEYKLDRIIIFVDDLDRLRPVKALELLESFKNFLDVEGCVFVLAVDYEVVQMGMKEKFGVDLQKQSGKSFFDKIIQLPFTMPASSYNLESYVQKLLGDIELKIDTKEAKSYYKTITEVTVLTVGSNPRSIKRVINYISLIKSLNRRKDGNAASFNSKEIPLLYSIVCMQIAWPEIFDYFIAQPTPERIKHIEDWNHLDTIPYINKLYNRSPNIDLVKSNISSFFDHLYSLIDEDGDGSITTKELKPIHDILYYCNYTQTNEFFEPIDSIIKLVQENGASDLVIFLNTAFRNSQWNSSSNINLIVSGKRYSTILYNRKQIGSLVTLKTDKLIFRLEVEASLLVESMKEKGFDVASNIIESIDNDSLSGFGRTRIRVEKIPGNDKQKVHFLNCLYDTVRDYIVT